MRCSSKQDGTGCRHPAAWVIKGASFKMFSCGDHLNRVCLIMVTQGLTHMTVSVIEAEP